MAVSGFAGTGKTTAVDHLARSFPGTLVYLGEVVLDEMERHGLERTRANEHATRRRLRAEGGADAMVRAREGRISCLLGNGAVIMVDAILNPVELGRLREIVGPSPFTLIALRASLDVRCDRLAKRLERSFSPDDLRQRDEHEQGELGIGDVMDAADHQVWNDGSLEEFTARLDLVIQQIRSEPMP